MVQRWFRVAGYEAEGIFLPVEVEKNTTVLIAKWNALNYFGIPLPKQRVMFLDLHELPDDHSIGNMSDQELKSLRIVFAIHPDLRKKMKAVTGWFGQPAVDAMGSEPPTAPTADTGSGSQESLISSTEHQKHTSRRFLDRMFPSWSKRGGGSESQERLTTSDVPRQLKVILAPTNGRATITVNVHSNDQIERAIRRETKLLRSALDELLSHECAYMLVSGTAAVVVDRSWSFQRHDIRNEDVINVVPKMTLPRG